MKRFYLKAVRNFLVIMVLIIIFTNSSELFEIIKDFFLNKNGLEITGILAVVYFGAIIYSVRNIGRKADKTEKEDSEEDEAK